MTMTVSRQEVLQLEDRYWQAMKDRDVDAALQLTADPCVIAGASGVARVDHETYVQLMRGAAWEIRDVTISDAEVTMLTDDVASVVYRVREDLMVDGTPVTLDAADSSVWVRRNGAWLCALHTESVLGDAYGRDRTPARVEE